MDTMHQSGQWCEQLGGSPDLPQCVQLQHIGLCERHDGADGGQQTGPYAKFVRPGSGQSHLSND